MSNEYSLASERHNALDLAFNGLLDKHTAADPRHAPTPEQFRSAQQKTSVLLDQAKGRQFTDSEAVEWGAALHTQASHYAAEEGRAR